MPKKNAQDVLSSVRELIGDVDVAARMLDQLRQMQPYNVNDELKKLTQLMRPISVTTELQAIAALAKPISITEELRKTFGALTSRDVTAELRKLSRIDSSLTDEFAKFGNLHKQQSITSELEKIASLRQPADLAGQFRAMAESIAVGPHRISDLLTASLSTYQTLYGTYRPVVALRRAEPPAVQQRDREPNQTTAERSATTPSPEEIRIVEAAAESVTTAVASGRVDALSAEFYLNLIITILLLALQLRLSDESEKRLTEQIASAEMSIMERLSAIDAAADHRTLIYARRALDLHVAPTSHADIVAIWFPNVPGRIVDERQHWVCVEYFDRAAQRHISGWCRKKYVLRS